MQAKSFKRIEATFGFLRNYKANFCTNVKPKTEEAFVDKKVYEGILFNQHTKYVSEIVLNQPKSLNSVDLKMIKNLLKKVKHCIPYNNQLYASETEESDFEKNLNVPKVILMTGAGDKAFCAGGDIKALYNAKIKNENIKILKDFFRYIKFDKDNLKTFVKSFNFLSFLIKNNNIYLILKLDMSIYWIIH